MSLIYDLPEDTVRQLRKLTDYDPIRAAADDALARPARRCKSNDARVLRLTISEEVRTDLIARLRTRLAREGFEEDGYSMLPIGHIYEGLIRTFSRRSFCAV